MNKRNQGITLIALVVTIVVLLILAGISISMLKGENGVITQTQKSQIENNHSSVLEAMQLETQNFNTNKITGEISTDVLTFLKEEGKIDENNIVNVKNTLQKKLTTGNGTGTSDVYIVEENDDGVYELIYYDKDQNPRDLGPLIKAENEIEIEDAKYFDITEDGTVSIKREYGYYYEQTSDRWVCDWSNWTLEELTVPSKINGIQVKNISSHFLTENKVIKKVYLSNGISSISFDSFAKCTNLTNVEIPDSMKSISKYAFSGTKFKKNFPIGDVYLGKIYYMYNGEMPSGTTIRIKDGTKAIGSEAFCNLSNLTKVEMPDSVETIEERVFYGCSNLEDITFSENLGYLGYNVFEGTKFIDNLPDGEIYFGKIFYMYNGEMPSNTSVIIKEGTTTIYDAAFRGCENLISISIPSSIINISYNAFDYCSGLTSIKVSEGNEQYDSRNNCNAIINKENNELIRGCKTTIIPNSVTGIGNRAFYGCEELVSIIIPDSVTYIDDSAFEECSELTTVTIPSSVTYIGSYAFGWGSALTTINYTGSEDEWNKIDKNIDLTNITINYNYKQ